MKRPVLRSQTLKIPDEFSGNDQLIRPGSAAWQLWLEDNHSFRAEIAIPRDRITLSLRKEINGRHKTAYWYAYAKIDGKTRKKYVGQSTEITPDHHHLLLLALQRLPTQGLLSKH